MLDHPRISIYELAGRLKDAAVYGEDTAEIHGITHDSRAVQPGDLFVCIQGDVFDGHRFAADALGKGAAAVVVNAGGLEKVGITLPVNTCILTVPDTRLALPLLACALQGDPSHALLTIGVTGTNGKTTTVRMVASILKAAGRSVGMIGTLGAELDGTPIPSAHTTPEADQLQALLARMRDAGADAVVMEVSSHALAQHRTDGIAFSAGIFTNITQDHLDFHGTMESYFDAKARLFDEYPVLYPRPDGTPFVSVINVASWPGRDLVTRARGAIVTYTSASSPAVLHAENVQLGAESVRFDAAYDSGVEKFTLPIDLPIGGAFQVGNALGAIGATLRLGIPREAVVAGLRELPTVPGRFESIATGERGFSVIVDYAHTPDGLENLLRSARSLEPKRLVLAFGCGGDRDRGKRPIMGHLAANLAEVAIVTSDNPREEDPNAIIAEILAGIEAGAEEGDAARAQVHVEPDRRAAIALALQLAQPGDIVLIAGKGHEDYQIIGATRHHFDDREVAREILAQLPGPTAKSAGGAQ